MIKCNLKKGGTYAMFVNDKYLEKFNVEVSESLTGLSINLMKKK